MQSINIITNPNTNPINNSHSNRHSNNIIGINGQKKDGNIIPNKSTLKLAYKHRDKGQQKLQPHRINHQIKSPQVRLVHPHINEGGDTPTTNTNPAQSEVVSLQKALSLSIELGLDLVEIAPKANPPVCKIMNYGKFLYREQKNHKKEKHAKIKEIGCHVNIAEHDLHTKIRHAEEFLSQGHQVCFKVQFRGRESVHKEMGIALLESIGQTLANSGLGSPDGIAKINGKIATIRFCPKKSKQKLT
jgi:translation initiation factor IF-3